jgi:RsiW-degrading membrane proteinase PrsW (M82 family)
MPFSYSLLAASVPMIIYLIFIWKLDKYEREPFGKVVKHFFWGAFGAVFLGIIFSSLVNSTFGLIIPQATILSFFSTVIVAPFVEEIVKGVYLLRSYSKNYFDNLTDGLVYGGAIGLGFGMTENLLYFITYDETFAQWISIVITRSIFSAVMHGIATATVGAFLAKAKFTLSSSKYLYLFWGLCLAIFFHATWNLSLSFEFTYLLGIAFMIFLIAAFLIIFNFSIKNEQRIISAELANETNLLISESINKALEKNLLKGIAKRIIIKKHANFTTKLAFRKFQARNSEGIQKEFYLSEIDLYRKKIYELINKING